MSVKPSELYTYPYPWTSAEARKKHADRVAQQKERAEARERQQREAEVKRAARERKAREALEGRQKPKPEPVRQPPNALNPAPRARSWAEIHAHKIGWGENYLASQLRCAGVLITQQQPVGRFLIDLGAWPVAFEVWTGGGFPTRSLPLQRRRTVALVEQGWTVAYVKTSQRYESGFSPHVGRWLKNLRDFALDGLAPPVVTFRGCGVALEGAVVDGELVHVPHPDPTWQRWADWTRGAEADARREYAKQRVRERRAERRLYGR